MSKDKLQVQMVVFKCKTCQKMVEHFTRKPAMMTKEYCDECLYRRRYVSKRIRLHS